MRSVSDWNRLLALNERNGNLSRRVYACVGVCFAMVLVSGNPAGGDLIPRRSFSKPDTVTKPSFNSRLTVKFRDDLRVRAVAGKPFSVVSASLANVGAVKRQFGLTFDPLIALPEQTLHFIEARAAQRACPARSCWDHVGAWPRIQPRSGSACFAAPQ